MGFRKRILTAAIVGLLLVPLWGMRSTALADGWDVPSLSTDRTTGELTVYHDQALISPDSGAASETIASTQSPFVIALPKPVPPFPIILNEAVQRDISAFLASDDFESRLDRGRPYLPEMADELRQRGVPEDLVYLAFAESAFSRQRRGWWQFNEVTAKQYGLSVNTYVDERRDPILSTRAAAKYLSDLYEASAHDWPLAVVGWNGGDAAIDRYWALRGSRLYGLMDRLPDCTRELLARFMATAFIANNASAYGITKVDLDTSGRAAYQVIQARRGTTLNSLAATYHTSVARLHELNPALLKGCVPPNVRSYKIRVPLSSRIRS